MTKIPQDHLSPTVEIGKNGLTKRVVEEIKSQLKNKKVVKVSLRDSSLQSATETGDKEGDTVPGSASASRKELARQVVERTGAKKHKLVGKKLTLYNS